MKKITNKLRNEVTGEYETIDGDLTKLAAIQDKQTWADGNYRAAFHFNWEHNGGTNKETILPSKYRPKVKPYLVPSWEKQVLSAPDPFQTPLFKRTDPQIEKLERIKIMGVNQYTEIEHALWNRGKYKDSKEFRNEITKTGKIEYRKRITRRSAIENKFAETFNELLKVVISEDEIIVIPLFKLLKDERVINLLERRQTLNKLARSIGKDEFVLDSKKKQLDPKSDNYDPREYLVKLLLGFGIYAEAKRYTPEEEKENTQRRKRFIDLWKKAKDTETNSLFEAMRLDSQKKDRLSCYNFNTFIADLFNTNTGSVFLKSEMQSAARYWSNLDKGRYLVLHNSCKLETLVNHSLPQSMEVQ